jgi:hypothetical protein
MNRMRNNSLKRTPAPRDLPGLFSIHTAFCFLLVLSVAVYASAAPSFVLQDLTESESPVEQDEFREEATIRDNARARVRRSQPGFSLPVSAIADLRSSVRLVEFPKSGHRLSNLCLAPLRL